MARTIYSPPRRARGCFPTYLSKLCFNRCFVNQRCDNLSLHLECICVHDLMKGFKFIFLPQMSPFPQCNFPNDFSLTTLLYIKFTQCCVQVLLHDQILGNGLILQHERKNQHAQKVMLSKNLLLLFIRTFIISLNINIKFLQTYLSHFLLSKISKIFMDFVDRQGISYFLMKYLKCTDRE